MDSNTSLKAKPKTVKEFLRSKYFWKPFIGIIAGGLVGFLYYYFIGCTSGTCSITSSPYGSVFMGSLLGFLITA